MAIVIILFFYFNEFSFEEIDFQCSIVLSTELSTYFIATRDYIKNKYFSKINDYIFMVTFYFLRMYLLPKYLLLDKDHLNRTHEIMGDKSDTLTNLMRIFMVINTYWACIIMKKFVKGIGFTQGIKEKIMDNKTVLCCFIASLILSILLIKDNVFLNKTILEITFICCLIQVNSFYEYTWTATMYGCLFYYLYLEVI